MAEKVRMTSLTSRWGDLKSERSSWWAHWQDLSSFLLPRSGRFFVQDRNNGARKDNNLIDSTATRSLRILGAGMMAGATSPARPWFKLTTPDEELNKEHSVKVWLDDVTKLFLRIFARSNTYRALHQIYEELGCYGTGVTLSLPDFENVIHNYMLTCGEYALGVNVKGEVDTLYREYEQTVSMMVREFGYDQCSKTVQGLYKSGSLDTWVPIMQIIEPRADRDIRKRNNKNMPWASYHFEVGAREGQFLRESGFNYFPVLAPRWSVVGTNAYGDSPGMEALGFARQLMQQQIRKGQGIDYLTKPPLQIPIALKNHEIDTLPGGATYYDPTSPSGGIKPLFEVQLDLSHLSAEIQDVREQIRGAFYADLFLMLANVTDTRMTATEVAERHEEKLLMLGPVLERLHNELLNPLIENTFSRALTVGILPPPPPEMQGVEINVEFVSMLAQAQRAVGANSVDRWTGNLGAVAQFKPDVLDKFDADYWAEAYADMLGVDPRMIVPNDKVAIVRKAKTEAAQQAQAGMMAEQQSKTAKNLATSPMNQDNLLTNVLDQFTGYNTPSVLP